MINCMACHPSSFAFGEAEKRVEHIMVEIKAPSLYSNRIVISSC